MKALKKLYGRDVHISRLTLLMLAWLIFMAATKFGKFFTSVSLQTMLSQFPEFGLMALGVMLCMVTGGIDLSVVGVANFTSISMGILLKRMAAPDGAISPASIALVFALGMGLGALCGAFNGILVSRVGIPPILATLGTSQLFTGIGIVLTEGKAVSKLPALYAEVVAGKIGWLPVQSAIFIAMALFVGWLLARTTYGPRIYLLGTSARAAKFSGLNNDRLLVETYLLSGVCAALGGLVMLANYTSARADYGAVYTLQCVLIVVLGGVSPNGGKGKLSGVVLAIVFLQLLTSGLNRFREVNPFLIPLIWGGVLVLVMVWDYFTARGTRA
ncbi:MAG: ABC transporter permease [Christensenellaceae bacterium]|nr:ABC transporter permease [Christensenellaceae bacterium]MEA5069022.1 ABC transporter permease [Christensenellaceae bacterium]